MRLAVVVTLHQDVIHLGIRPMAETDSASTVVNQSLISLSKKPNTQCREKATEIGNKFISHAFRGANSPFKDMKSDLIIF